MDQAVKERAGETGKGGHHDVAVAVVTPTGIYPGEEELSRVDESVLVAKVLKAAAETLGITNTTDWVASLHGKEIDVNRSFKDLKLNCIVEIDYHKREGGGGA
jgi:hypothetical protein